MYSSRGTFVADPPFRSGANFHELVPGFRKDRDESATLSSREVKLSSPTCLSAMLCKAFKWWGRLELCLKLDEYAALLRGAQYSLMTTRVYSQSMERSGIPAYTNQLVNLLVEARSWAEVLMRSRCCFTAPGLARNLLSTHQPMNAVFVCKIRDRYTIACEVKLEHGET
jgi:hypothetical protein